MSVLYFILKLLTHTIFVNVQNCWLSTARFYKKIEKAIEKMSETATIGVL